MGLAPFARLNTAHPRLGPNLAPFLLLIGINALVGTMLGQERTVFPLLAGKEFDLTGYAVALTFVLAFGLVKAAPTSPAHPGGGCPHRRLRSGGGVADD